MRVYLGILLILVLAFAFDWFPNEIKRPRGVLVSGEPDQELIAQGRPWPYKAYQITPLANFHLRARVLMTERYWLGREAQISPMDLTVGWRLMSDQNILDQLDIYRGYRAFYWKPKTAQWPAAHEDITEHVANLHMIPANSAIDSRLKSIRPGNLIDLRGYLVLAEAPDGWHWRSSLSRTDEGPGACELVWAENLAAN
ncbi:MAG: hypothetical protein ABSH50_07905 [Bryobacteraceae bacterium]|jgi:hypothetical protein